METKDIVNQGDKLSTGALIAVKIRHTQLPAKSN